VQELDQEVAPTFPRAQQRLNLAKRSIIKAATLGTTITAAPILKCHHLSPWQFTGPGKLEA
jgi:hypothetical protein